VAAAPERTPDGRYLVIDGRRWRAADPGIPEPLRQELVDELMAARRAVRAEGDAARHRVHDAKVALGERGEPWWDEPSAAGLAARLGAAARTLRRRRDGAEVSAEDVARIAAGEGWRAVLDDAERALGTITPG
jgi:hypothetical protein